MSHTSSYRARITTVDPAVMAQTMQLIQEDPARQHIKVVENFTQSFDSTHWTYALQPAGTDPWLGLGVRVEPNGELVIGKDDGETLLREFRTEAEQAVIQTYVSALLMQAAPELGMGVEVLQQGTVGQPNRLSLSVA